jgi:hypothetical protein
LLYLLTVVVVFARRLVASGQEPDVRLSTAGVNWRAPWGEKLEVPRAKIEGFRIERQNGGEAAAPTLTLLLHDGFESWPLEIHSPATAPAVRDFLAHTLGVPERPPANEDFDARYQELLGSVEDDTALDERIARQMAADAQRLGFFAEADVVQRIWRFEGTRQRLLDLCSQWEGAAAGLRVAPPYARPQRHELGGWAMRLLVEADEEPWLTDGVIGGPPAWHRELASAARRRVEAMGQVGEATFDAPATRWKLRWVIHAEGFDPAALISFSSEG